MQELQGVIDNIVFQSEDNQFSVFRVKTDHEGKVSVVYRGPAPFLGESVELSGSWGEHAKFGRQFRAEVCQAIKPSTTDGVERFLASGAVRGIGKTMAARIVEHFGSDYAGCFIFITASPDRDFRYRQKEGRSYWDVLCRVVGYAGIDGVFGIARRQC